MPPSCLGVVVGLVRAILVPTCVLLALVAPQCHRALAYGRHMEGAQTMFRNIWTCTSVPLSETQCPDQQFCLQPQSFSFSPRLSSTLKPKGSLSPLNLIMHPLLALFSDSTRCLLQSKSELLRCKRAQLIVIGLPSAPPSPATGAYTSCPSNPEPLDVSRHTLRPYSSAGAAPVPWSALSVFVRRTNDCSSLRAQLGGASSVKPPLRS